MSNKKNKSPKNASSSGKTKQINDISINANDKLYYIVLGLILLLIYIIRKHYFEIPFERDEGSYAYCGKIILEGAIPFKDIGSQRLDGVFYAYSFLVAIFGYSVKALHVAFLFINLGSTVMLFFLGRKLGNNLTGIAASAFFALLSMTAGASGFTIQSEHLVAFFVIAAFLALFYFFERSKWYLLIISGIFFSFAFQIKQTSAFYGMFAGCILLFKNFYDDKAGVKKTIINALLFASAVIIPLLIDLLLIYKNGAWEDFNLWFFDIRKQYTSLISFDQGLDYLKYSFDGMYKDYSAFWIFSFIAMPLVFFTKLPLWKKITVAGLNVTGFLTVVPGYHYYGHYFLQWIPAVAIAAAMFIFSVQHFTNLKLGNNAILVLLIPGVLAAIPVFSNLKKLSNYYFNPDLKQVVRSVYGMNPFPESKVVADKLNSVMKESDKIAVLGTEIQMYVYTNKISPSRFAGSGALLEFPVAQSNDWQKEFIADVEKVSPRFLVFFNHPISWMANPKTENLLFPWFNKYSSEQYRLYGYADMINAYSTNYVWATNPNEQLPKPQGQYVIYVFERK